MAKKRKLNSNSVSEPVKEPERIIEEENPEELDDDEEELEEEEEEEEVEEYEEAEEEEDEEEEREDEDDSEPMPSVLSSLSKETLIALLSDAAGRHPDVAERVRDSADTDPSRRKLFVHGLPWGTTNEMLLEEFLKYGEIEDCHHVTDKVTGKSKGFAFILFKSARAAREALKEPQKVINNRMTACQLASLGSNAAQQQQQPESAGPAQKKIYISNVGPDLDPEKLKVFFSKFGEIEEGPLGLDKQTGRAKGFCLFVYKTVESAKRALAEPHKEFEGVTLRCYKAIDGSKSQKEQLIKAQMQNKNVNPSQKSSKQPLVSSRVAPGVIGSASAGVIGPAAGQGNLMAPSLVQQQQQPGLNVNPAALGQALTTLLSAQRGAGMNLNLLAALGAVGLGAGLVNNPSAVPGGSGSQQQFVQGGYGINQGGVGAVPGASTVVGLRGMYPNQQTGQGGAGGTQYGSRPYFGQ